MSNIAFADFIKECTNGFTPVIDAKFQREDYVHIDLSEANKEIREIKLPSAATFKKLIGDYISAHHAKVAYGGYNEKRNLYKDSEMFNDEKTASPRNIHIGLDFWCGAGTAVLAPLEGTVHSFEDNTGFGNYGPTIILEHNFDDKQFYTLYGHLKRESIENLCFGQIIEAGEKIGELGSTKINGNYAPHLHFQIIEDLQGDFGDYPGVVAKEDLDFYLKNCPDPNLLLKIN